jgi:protein involved in polysaccharide export with SLBB domain
MFTKAKFLNLLSFFIFFNIYIVEAQAPKQAARSQSSNASTTNLPDVLNGSDLSQFSADQLSDSQLAALQSQLQGSGMSLDRAGQIAMSKGMPSAEWQKLENRLQNSSKSATASQAQPTSAERQTVPSDMKVYQKEVNPALFGSALFSTPSLSFEPNLRIATPSNYILGPDDDVSISVSGVQETNLHATVQPEGNIFIPQVGPILVNGLTIEEATARIKSKMAQTAYPSLRNGASSLIISLNKIRSINITIIGAAKPGNYTVSSLTTLFNSLYLCGGPGDINTFRNIELIRNNKLYKVIDLYQFLTRGDIQGNILLKENDVINFPVYKKHVSVQGEVKRPAIFELKGGETFEDLLFFAGGFTGKAYKATVKVTQITDIERRIKDIAKADFASYEPENGDEIKVDTILSRIENAIAINGAVYRPGEFELTPGLTLSTLIKRAGGLQEDVFTGRAVITREHADGTLENITFNVRDILNGTTADIPMVRRDNVTIAAAGNFISKYAVSVQGEVRKPGDYPYKQNMSLKDLLFLAGGFTDAASSYHLEVSRRLINERTSTNVDTIAVVYNINIDKNLSVDENRFVLQPFDIIAIRRNPGYTQQQQTTINGEVNFPGNYTIQFKNERISSLIKRAGGLTPFAYNKGVFLIRKYSQTDTTNQKNIKNIEASIKDTSGKVTADLATTNNRIAVNLKEVLDKPGSIEDYVLQDGDIVQVLKFNPLVKVSGQVLEATETGYIDGKSLSYYLSEAGGTADGARRSKIYVIYPDGGINRAKNGIFGLFRSYPQIKPGAEIVVPLKVQQQQLSTAEKVGITSAIVSIVSLIAITISTLNR